MHNFFPYQSISSIYVLLLVKTLLFMTKEGIFILSHEADSVIEMDELCKQIMLMRDSL